MSEKIKAIAKIERDAQNFFFVKMLYGYESKVKPCTIYEIEDATFINKLIDITQKALEVYPIRRDIGTAIVIYEPITKFCFFGNSTCYKKTDTIIVGTTSANNFYEINYLIRMLSQTIEKNNMGEFWIQYKDNFMTEQEFYELQNVLSIYNV